MNHVLLEGTSRCRRAGFKVQPFYLDREGGVPRKDEAVARLLEEKWDSRRLTTVGHGF